MADGVHASDSRSWCFFRSGHEPYAVPVESVVEIVAVDSHVQLPVSPPCLVGLCALRREVIPVIRLTADPHAEVDGADTKKAVLVLTSSKGTWGIQIDRAGAVVSGAVSDLGGAPGCEERTLATGRSIARGGTVYAVVDPETAWQEVRVSVERCYRRSVEPEMSLAAESC